MSNLLDLKPFIEQVVEAIAAVHELDVTIIDSNLKRIAGTGMYKTNFNINPMKGCATEQVIESKKPLVIIEKPGEPCFKCALKGNCPEKAIILQPIMAVAGVIGLIAFDDKQKNTILKQKEKLLLYVEKMSALISSKLREQDVINKNLLITNQLRITFNTVDEGLIYIDNKMVIKQINKAACELLGVSPKDLLNKEIFRGRLRENLGRVFKSTRSLEEKEIYENFRGKRIHVLCNIKPVVITGNLEGAIISLKEFSRVERLVSKVTGNQRAYTFDDIIGESGLIREVKDRALRIAKTDSTVLITGESGTGKELIARAIHSESLRRNGPFISINCAAIPETLLESELFGYEEGAFSGAKKGGKPGKFQLAHNGTLFLDEIGEMPLYLQTKLLRVIQEKVIDKIGGPQPVEVNIRIIAATNKNLEESIRKGEFREDLYYRINVIPINIPPLRDRKEDIYPLAEYFLKKYNGIFKKNIKGFSMEVAAVISKYNWPGNIRELENVVEYMVNFENSDIIREDSLPIKLKEYLEGCCNNPETWHTADFCVVFNGIFQLCGFPAHVSAYLLG